MKRYARMYDARAHRASPIELMLQEHDTDRRTANALLDTPVALEISDLRVSYSAQPVLEDVSFRLPRGQLVGIIGPNGAGKTTLLKAILGLVPRSGGSVAVCGEAVRGRGGRVA